MNAQQLQAAGDALQNGSQPPKGGCPVIAGEAFIASFETQESLVCLRVPKNGVAEIGALEVGQGWRGPGTRTMARTAPPGHCARQWVSVDVGAWL